MAYKFKTYFNNSKTLHFIQAFPEIVQLKRVARCAHDFWE